MSAATRARGRWVPACGIVLACLALGLWWTTRAPALPPVEGDRVGVDLGDTRLVVELAVEATVQYRGLSGRASIDPLGGMLFVYPTPRAMQFVMRDCLVPIDIAFLDTRGTVVAVHAMEVETPRQPWESSREYEQRLRRYTSPPDAQFALELAGGRLRELGVGVGSRVRFDVATVLGRAGVDTGPGGGAR